MKTILAGVDGSDTAAAAARRAAEVAQAFGATLHVVTAYGTFRREEVSDGLGGEKIVITSDRDALSTAGKAAEELRRLHPGLAVASEPAEGKPAEALLNTAKRLDADLIVVGNRRVQGPARVLGSVAREVAQKATCDLYVAYTHPRRTS